MELEKHRIAATLAKTLVGNLAAARIAESLLGNWRIARNRVMRMMQKTVACSVHWGWKGSLRMKEDGKSWT